MQTVYTALTAAVIIYLLIYLIFLLLSKKPIKTLLLFAMCGILSLAAVKLTGRYTGVDLPINPYTVCVSAGGGIMGTAALLVIKTIFSL